MAKTPLMTSVRGRVPFPIAGEGVYLAMYPSFLIELEEEFGEEDWVNLSYASFGKASAKSLEALVRKLTYKDEKPVNIGYIDLPGPPIMTEIVNQIRDALFGSIHGKTEKEFFDEQRAAGAANPSPESPEDSSKDSSGPESAQG